MSISIASEIHNLLMKYLNSTWWESRWQHQISLTIFRTSFYATTCTLIIKKLALRNRFLTKEWDAKNFWVQKINFGWKLNWKEANFKLAIRKKVHWELYLPDVKCIHNKTRRWWRWRLYISLCKYCNNLQHAVSAVIFLIQFSSGEKWSDFIVGNWFIRLCCAIVLLRAQFTWYSGFVTVMKRLFTILGSLGVICYAKIFI